MRVSSPQRTRIIRLGERALRKFFEHPMSTYAAALAYRGLFGLFPLVLILVVLVGALGLPESVQGLIEQGRSESSQQVPEQLEPVVERGREQIQPLERMIEQAQRQAGGELLFFGVALALWSISALAGTLTEALNAAYEVPETRRWWKVSALSWAFGPVLALMVIVSVGLMLIGPGLVERIAELVGLDEVFVSLWGWLRFPIALALLAVVLSLVYRFGPDAKQRFRSVGVGAAFAVVLWAIASVGFSFYLANFADYGVTYGSLGAAVGLLFYLYLSASVVLLGAEVNAAIYHAAPDTTMEAELPGSSETETTDARGRRMRDV
jgi:membrane protein